MADFVFNIAKGRVAELYNRVDTNDPTNAALVIVVLATSGLEADSALKDYATLSAVLAGTTNEVTNTNYARKTLVDTDLTSIGSSPMPNTSTDVFDLDFADQTWTAVAAGDGWSKLLVCYDSDTTAGTDANIVPLTAHDFVVTPDGSDITAVVSSNGFYRAS